MIGNILIVVSAMVSILAVLDLYLSDAQKKRLSGKTQELWSRLDDLSRLRFMDFIRVTSVQKWIAWTAAVATFAGFATWLGASIFVARAELLTIVALLILFGWLGPRLMAFTLRKRSALQVIARTAVIAACYAAIAAALVFPIGVLMLEHASGNDPPYMELVVPALLFIWFAAIVLILTVLAPLAFVVVAKAGLSALELTVRRIAESPKGPILATSALLAGVVAIIKIFS